MKEKRFSPGQRVVCNTKRHQMRGGRPGGYFNMKDAPQFNEIYTVREYALFSEPDNLWLIFIFELPVNIAYGEDLFDPLDESAVTEALKILEEIPAGV